MQLTGSLCNVEVILEETADCSGSFLIDFLRNIRAEDFLKEVLAQGNRKLVDEAPDPQFIIRKYSLL